MTRIVVDPNLHTKLEQLEEPVELCNKSGRVIGRFTPLPDGDPAKMRPQVSDEELQRRKISGGKRYTTAEVLARLEGR
jgi:hypothetical protein